MSNAPGTSYRRTGNEKNHDVGTSGGTSHKLNEAANTMIRRQRKANLATDTTYHIQSDNDRIIKENLPTTLISAPTSNGYFHVDTSSSTGSAIQYDRYRRRRKKLKSKEKYSLTVSRLWIVIIIGIFYCFCMSYFTLTSYTRTNQRLHTPVLSSVNYNFTIIFPPQRLRLPSIRTLVLPNIQSSYIAGDKHDYGSLELRFPEYRTTQDNPRVIYHDSFEDTGYEELWYAADDDGSMESYYAFDDDEKRNPLVMYDDPDIHLRKKCRRTNWHRQLPITCNNIHEFDFQSRIGVGDAKYIGNGYYRTVFLSSTTTTHIESVVVKMLNWRYNFTYDDFEYMRMDAIVNEKLNGNPEIVHSYSFCGNSIIGEAMAFGDLHKLAVPAGIGRQLPNIDNEKDLVVRNTLSGTQKLEWSLQMAESLLLLHSFPSGVIVHDDIQLSQFLLSESGKLKLNDFNRAEIMLWNERDQEYCKYRNYPGWGDWRSPEEYADKPLDEKIDIWSLGNNMYALLTGVYPFYSLTEVETQGMVMNGTTAFIDPRYKERSFAESKLVEIIPQCWIYDPRQRIDIFRIVDFLRNAVQESKRY